MDSSTSSLTLLNKLLTLNCTHIAYEIYKNFTILELYKLHTENPTLQKSISSFLKKITSKPVVIIKPSKNIKLKNSQANSNFKNKISYHTVTPGHYRDYFLEARTKPVSNDTIHKLLLSSCIKASTFFNFLLKGGEDYFNGQLIRADLVEPILTFLLKHGADPNVQTCRKKPSYSSGWSALHFSVLNNNFEIINLLLSFKADIFNQNTIGCTPFGLLADQHKDNQSIDKILHIFENYKILSNNSKTLNNKGNYVILLTAIECNNTALIRALVKYGVNVDRLNLDCNDGEQLLETALVVAIRSDKIYSTSVMRVLIEVGADVNLVYDEGSPLYKAILTGNPAKIKLLIENGADYNYVSQNAETFGLTCLQLVKQFAVDFGFDPDFLSYLNSLA